MTESKRIPEESVTQNYTRHNKSPLSSEHLRQLDCLYQAYNQEGNSEGDRRFYWAKIQQLTNSLTDRVFHSY